MAKLKSICGWHENRRDTLSYDLVQHRLRLGRLCQLKTWLEARERQEPSSNPA